MIKRITTIRKHLLSIRTYVSLLFLMLLMLPSKPSFGLKALPILPQEISGSISDAAGNPIPGVNVLEKGTTNGVQADVDGSFSINVSNGATLVFSFVGFQSKEVQVLPNKGNYDIVLEEEVGNLEEVVVVGYGTQKKVNVTGSVASIKTDNVIRAPVTNVKSMLIGQTSGIITNQNPGLPGQDNVNLSIRGFGNPLVIVDGVESFLDRIDPNDIESITVLKDGAAAIYGVRGGDGVILITTKRGKAGVMSVDYHGFTGTQRPVNFMQPANAADFIQAKRDGVFNAQYDPANPNADIAYGEWTEEFKNQYETGQLTSYNWVDAMLKQNGGRIISNNISASGGTEKVRYYTSLGHVNQDGIFNGDFTYNKFTITNNLDVKLTNRLNFSLTSSYIDEKRDYPSASINTAWNDLRTALPFENPFLPDPNRAPYSGFTERSPVARTQQKFSGYDLTNLQTLAAAGELKYSAPFLEGLTIGLKANVRMRRIYNERLNRTYTVYRYDESTQEYSPVSTVNRDPSFRKSFTSTGDDPRLRILSRFYLNYNQTFNSDHEVGALAFIEREDNEVNSLSGFRRELLSDDVPTIIAGDDALTTTGGNGLPIEYSRISLASRLNYAYKGKYLLEATLRADASSKFSPQVRWGYFPSVSAGWNIAREDFMSTTSFSELKLRASYSQTGRDNVVSNTAFDFLTGFEELSSVYYLDGVPITQILTTGLVNPFLTWEKVTLYNAGLDFSLMNNKLYGNVDAFFRLRDGIFGPAVENLPSTFGADLPLVNINSITHRGFEFLVGYRDQVGDFKYDLSANFTMSRQKYRDWQEDIDIDDPNQVRINQRTGNYVNRLFGYVSDGLINSNEELEAYVGSLTFETLNGQPGLGDIRYTDVSGPDGTPDGVINRFDLRQVGFGAQPDITFGLNSQLSYKNLSLMMIWQGASMFNVIANGNFRNPFDNEVAATTLHAQYSWTQDPNNPGVGNNPDAQLPAFNNDGNRLWNQNFSDFWVRDGTFVRLKTATLSYRLGSNVMQKIGLNDAELYVTGDNLFTLNRLGIYGDIIDPEQAYNNGGYSIPLLRSFTVGLRLGF